MQLDPSALSTNLTARVSFRNSEASYVWGANSFIVSTSTGIENNADAAFWIAGLDIREYDLPGSIWP